MAERRTLLVTGNSPGRGEERLHANVLTPVLISGKQGLSKSTFCRLLMPDSLRHYFVDNLNLAAGSSPEKKLVKNGLINLDEFDKIKESSSNGECSRFSWQATGMGE